MVLILVGFCWVIWLERYVVYTRDGATLNFELKDTPGAGQLAMPPSAGETVPIYVNEGLDAIDLDKELEQISAPCFRLPLRGAAASGIPCCGT